MKYFFISSLFLFFFPPWAASDNLKYTISGEAAEKAQLETLSPHPGIPDADSLVFSLDSGESALHEEVIPLDPQDAVFNSKLSDLVPFGIPTIPRAPFLAQVLPFDRKDLSLRNALKLDPQKPEEEQIRWEFKVVDENNKVWKTLSGSGFPPEPLGWDGTDGERFILDPNRTYIPMIILKGSSDTFQTWAGEAARYMAVAHQKGDQFTIDLGKKVYVTGKGQFSDESRIHLLEIKRLFSQQIGFWGSNTDENWSIQLLEPEVSASISEERIQLWTAFLEKILGQGIPLDRITVLPSMDDETRVRITLQHKDEPFLALLHGKAMTSPLNLDDASTWVNIKYFKGDMIVELRNDRLFYPGTAYIRDEVLPYLSRALAQTESEWKNSQKYVAGSKKKDSAITSRKIILRSFHEHARDQKKIKRESDPKLAALRTKVLFTIFSEETLLSK